MSWLDRLVVLPRLTKRLLIGLSDFALLIFAVWAAFSIRLGVFYFPPDWPFFGLLISAALIGVIILERFGIYRMVTRFVGHIGRMRIVYAVSLTVVCWGMVVTLARVPGIFPRSSFILFWLIATILIIGSRALAGSVLTSYIAAPRRARPDKINVLIYGAGSAGHMLAKELAGSGTHEPIGFIDDDRSLWGQKVGSVKVRRPAKIAALVARNDIKEILLALPSATNKRRREVLNSLEKYPVRVKTVPSLGEIASGRVTVSDIRPISPDDLLGRDPVPPNEDLLQRDIAGKAVLITGAGGSIGSELARQVLERAPRTLVLFELSEVALYEIEIEMGELDEQLCRLPGGDGKCREPCEIVAVLGSVLDSNILHKTMDRYGIDTIYHAAAYKHVPIVELNPVAGLMNNTFGTRQIVEVARERQVARFVLISTDKAVRPTNIMGASKRLAELILQANAARPGTKTVFTMVRFGNVLASSGSVVRRFTKQIEAGGPVTVTHRDIIRYFMSIREAAQLVIQAGAMAGGGDVFVLDMGEPVKIDELARIMIRLSGLQVEDETNEGGDIAIEYTGLRPGEKLFEELLLGENTLSTGHERIMRSNEPLMAFEQLENELAELSRHMERYDINAIHGLLLRLVEGYRPETGYLENERPPRLKAS